MNKYLTEQYENVCPLPSILPKHIGIKISSGFGCTDYMLISFKQFEQILNIINQGEENETN